MLKSLPDLKYSPLGFNETVEVQFDGQILSAGLKGHAGGKWAVSLAENTVGPELALKNLEALPFEMFMQEKIKAVSAEYLFGHHPSLTALRFDDQRISREEYLQNTSLWTLGAEALKAEKWIHTGERFHPQRPKALPGICYKRYIPETGKTLTFRLADVQKDLALFHEWHNQDRVANFWELNKSEAELREYLEKGLADAHQIPLILEFDGEAAGYFEVYWVLEDRLGPYYESEAFDRGFHFLIGNEKFLGFDNTDAALRSIVHYIFLNDPRTRKIMAEPRSDNVKVLRYVDTFTAWKKLKEFDFPHKRAALLECRREKFFTQGSI